MAKGVNPSTDKKHEAETNFTDADRKCPDLKSHREKASKDIKALEEGEIIGNWKVRRPIEPERHFNKIFVVEHKEKGYLAALKMEKKEAEVPMLKLELFILLHMEKINSSHFCKVFDRGMAPEYNWMVITLAGRNFRFLRKACKNGKVSLASGLSVGKQCLKALEELHKVGFIHRSVNPSIFAIGRVINDDPKDLRNVYILDFGFARQYKETDGTHKLPRPNPSKYIGKPRYAPRNAYLKRELGRMDDLEMWLYVTVELVKGALPWVHQRNPKHIFDYQKSVRSGLGLREFLGGLPVEFVDIMKEVDKLSYSDAPSYEKIYSLMENAIKMSGQEEFPYDWEEGEIEAERAGEGPGALLKKEPQTALASSNQAK
uniref:Protein kinase domain-containing protein n=1 Tax=Angiostrongylus cantonensis TaxID=6313 RepID=A0A0K0DC48_ANGCA